MEKTAAGVLLTARRGLRPQQPEIWRNRKERQEGRLEAKWSELLSLVGYSRARKRMGKRSRMKGCAEPHLGDKNRK